MEKIKFGSLEHQIDAVRASQARQEERVQSGQPTSDGPPEVLPFSETTRIAQEKYQREMQELEMRQKERSSQSAIPVDDKLVQLRLRELGEPIIYFGEGPLERRERLKHIMALRGISVGMPQSTSSSGQTFEREKIELFFTEGPPQLKESRIFIANYSVPKALRRLQEAKKKQESFEKDPTLYEKELAYQKEVFASFDGMLHLSSQVGDDRPLSSVQFSPNGSHILTASWTGQCRTWKVATDELEHSFGMHTDRALCAVWHPQADEGSPSSCCLATSGADGRILLCSREKETPLHAIKAHEHRIPKIAFHPSGNFLASASLDRTYKLWDVATGTQLLEQEGHLMGVNTVGFQGDGSLISTGGADAIGRVWDLRSGRTVHLLRGHNKQISCLDWNPNGYQLVTGSEDNTLKIWDLRKKRNLYSIPAHEAAINHVTYHSEGRIIFSSGVDNTLRIWNGNNWTPVKIIKCLEGRVISAALSPNRQVIVTANYDRTWKKYGKEGTIYSHLQKNEKEEDVVAMETESNGVHANGNK